MKLIYTIFCLLFFTNASSAQTYVMGTVTNEETGEALEFANIVFYKNDVYSKGTSADLDGNYKIEIDPGTYDVEVSYTGLASKKVSDVNVQLGKENNLNIALSNGIIIICCIHSPRFKIPLLEQDNTSSGKEITSDQIKNMPTKNIHEISALVPGVSLQR